MHIERIILFLVDKEKGKQDGRLRMRVKWNRSQCIVSILLGFRVNPDKWSREAQRCTANTTHGKDHTPASVINREIQAYENAATEVFTAYEREETMPTADDFRAALRKALSRDTPATARTEIGLYIERFIAECSSLNNWTHGTVQKFETLRHHLEAFRQPATYRMFTEAGLLAFVEFLRDSRKMRNTTIRKQVALLKWFLKWSVRKGYTHDQTFERFNPHLKSAKKTVVYLTWEELMCVYSHPIPPEKRYLERVRDVFCLCCFTSLRYSDVARLRPDDIYDGAIHMVSHKTADTLTIELNGYSRAIIDRYRGGDYGGLAMPVISNQKMNDYLKELGALCGLDTPVTVTYYRGSERIDETRPKWALIGTHTARRTFICNALALGISPLVVMKWTGHESYATIKPYIEVADRTKAEAMRLFDTAGKEESRDGQSRDSLAADSIRPLT